MLKLSIKITFAGVLLLTSCTTNNKKLASYQVGEDINVISVGEALEILEPSLPMMPGLEISQITNDPEFLKQQVQAILLNEKMIVLEALEISNFMDDPSYIQSLEKQKEIIPYVLAMSKGQEEILKVVDNQKVTVAEVSRIMFTNNDIAQAQDVLGRLQSSENIIDDFSGLAAEFSQEPLGAQTGGYLGMVDNVTYPDLEEAVFNKKTEGLYPEIIQGEAGAYIVYVHTKAKQHKYKDIKEQALAISPTSIIQTYLAKHIKVLFARDGENITLGSKTYTLSEFPKDKDLVKIWNKGYSLNDLSILLEGFGIDPLSDNSILLTSLTQDGKPSVILEQMAVIFKEYSPSIKNSKEYKQALAREKTQLELQSSGMILSTHLFKDFSTNVTDEELRAAYAKPENRQVTGYNNNDQPMYASFQDSKASLANVVLREKASAIELAFLSPLAEKYNVMWDEKGLKALADKIVKLLPSQSEREMSFGDIPEARSEHDGHDH